MQQAYLEKRKCYIYLSHDTSDFRIKAHYRQCNNVIKMYFFFACLNRCQAKGKNYDTFWKMITRVTYLVILIITVSSFSTFHCPTNRTCNCDMNFDGAFELNCLTGNDSYFIVNIQPDQYIRVRVYLILYFI